MEITHEEPFCPAMPVIPFSSVGEALAAANDTPYGLASYVATRDAATAIKLAEGLDFNLIGVGDYSPATVLCPFGGIKESGIGREGGREGILDYVESKYVSLMLDG